MSLNRRYINDNKASSSSDGSTSNDEYEDEFPGSAEAAIQAAREEREIRNPSYISGELPEFTESSDTVAKSYSTSSINRSKSKSRNRDPLVGYRLRSSYSTPRSTSTSLRRKNSSLRLSSLPYESAETARLQETGDIEDTGDTEDTQDIKEQLEYIIAETDNLKYELEDYHVLINQLNEEGIEHLENRNFEGHRAVNRDIRKVLQKIQETRSAINQLESHIIALIKTFHKLS